MLNNYYTKTNIYNVVARILAKCPQIRRVLKITLNKIR